MMVPIVCFWRLQFVNYGLPNCSGQTCAVDQGECFQPTLVGGNFKAGETTCHARAMLVRFALRRFI